VHELDFNLNRAVTLFLAWAWPVILALYFLWGRDNARLTLLLYSGALLALCLRVALFSDTPPISVYGVMVPSFAKPLAYWSISVWPTLFLLLFLNRNVRAIGPALLVFVAVSLVGFFAGAIAGSSREVMTVSLELTNSATMALLLPKLAGVVSSRRWAGSSQG
jgi:hypothetical protein